MGNPHGNGDTDMHIVDLMGHAIESHNNLCFDLYLQPVTD